MNGIGRNPLKRKSTGWAAKCNSNKDGSFVGWTPHPPIKLLVGPTEQVILIHRRIVKELQLECPQKDPITISVPNVDPQCLRILLNFIYNDELNVGIDNVWNVLVTAWQFSYASAQTLCVDYIVDNIKKLDCWLMLRLAKMYDISDLIMYCQNYIARDLDCLRSRPPFLQLPYDEVIELFKSDEVCRSSSRASRCHAAITWIEHDIEQRKSHISELMTEVKLDSLTRESQNDILAHHSVFEKCPEWMKTQVLKDLEDLDETQSYLHIARNIFEDDPDISIEDYEDVIVKIEQEDLGPEIRRWPASEVDIILDSDEDYSVPAQPTLSSALLPPPPLPTLSSALLPPLPTLSSALLPPLPTLSSASPTNVPTLSSALPTTMPTLTSALQPPVLTLPPTLPSSKNDALIIISGIEENGYRAVWSYDVMTKTKIFLADVLARTSDAFLCRNDILYHLGGKKGDVVTEGVYSLKLQKDQLWVPCPPMTVTRCYFSAVVMKGDIYAIGGNIGEIDCVMNTVEVLKFDGENPSKEWEKIAFLNRSRDAYGVTVDDEDTIYVVGGCGQPNRRAKCSQVLPLVEEYPSPNGMWVSSKQMKQKRMFHSVVFLNGYIYAMGGWDGKCVLNSVECFDGNFTGKWESCPSMNIARKEMSALVLGGCIYVFGGKGQNDELLQSIEVYDPKTECWSFSDILSENEGPFHSVLVKC